MAFIETAKFPGGIATDADLLNTLNNSTGTLASAVGTIDTTITLQAGQGAAFPASNFAITIVAEGANSTEIVLISSRSTDTLTVATSGRGFDGTSASAHSAGAAVELRVTAKTHNKAVAEIGAIETAFQSLGNSSSEGFIRRTGANAYTQHQSNLAATANPTASNDSTQGYSVGSLWINTSSNPRTAFICVNAASGAAVWLQLSGIQAPTTVLKKGSGSGNYSTSSTSYVDVDATNLAYTVVIPVGSKLLVSAGCQCWNSTVNVGSYVSLYDSATLVEAEMSSNQIVGLALHWVIAGDGGSHTVKLQFKAASGATNMLNSSATLTPTIIFLLVQSN